ncbi:MAG: zinc-binding dehydrogenase [Macrococcus canis]|uniref:zinc-binding dehydrogenase n=1 Tax=Macrococcoides canis TaxID=1855823 RepID=UPI002E7A3108|nr:zinc-binding dehydrogenase [Macrococcus canis]MEE1107397.1 zinc-binding dehydrogenase [Macrococcus canis]
MKVAIKKDLGYDGMYLEDIAEPSLENHHVKIKVKFTGICGTDIHTYKGEYANAKLPLVLGHEFSGEVVEIGSDVTKVKIGDRVTSETTFTTCGECIYCKSKDYNLCPHRKGLGTQINGSMAEYVISREESIHILPDNVSYEAGALTEPVACVVHAALEKTTIEKDDVVLVLGPGPIGILLAQVVKAQSAKVIMTGITPDAKRLEFAKEIGVDLTIDTMQEDLKAILDRETDGNGPDKIFDCTGVVPAVNQALPFIKKKGTFVQVGIFKDHVTPIDTNAIIQREINYVGCRSQKPSSWPIALKLLSDGLINADKMITSKYKLDEFQEAFKAVMAGEDMKVLVES